ncbi:STAM-binding protein-like [Adelges cooleyi]|uniref:STAM-binding protein-like n=1 Tax=Adelges cooleyi TaxID=133065 RepID=UPI00217F49FF|nr:STAM-binding protein-like [Adelges cooleyi]
MSHGLDEVETIMLTPDQRLNQIFLFSSKVELNPNVAARKYYQSGIDMIRMAEVYLKDNNLEQAYILYNKFMVLFLETISTHPDYKNVPAEDRNANNRLLRDVLPRAENLKSQLKAQYSNEYEQYLEQKAIQEQKDREKLQGVYGDDGHEVSFNTNRVTEKHLNMILNNATTRTDFNNSGLKKRLPYLRNQYNFYKDPTILPSISSNVHSQHKCFDEKSHVDRNSNPVTKRLHNQRNIIVPGDLLQRFLDIVKNNTMVNLETCGILAGKLSVNSLIITTLLIPNQNCTPDSCTATNEEDIFEFQDTKNLMTLGWIHTHPSQASFMSSVDLHTHYAYQIMLPEAIAIVCATKFNNNSFFTLTPYGVQFIASCKSASGFHTHNVDNEDMYAIAEHILWDYSLLVNIIDFRQ